LIQKSNKKDQDKKEWLRPFLPASPTWTLCCYSFNQQFVMCAK